MLKLTQTFAQAKHSGELYHCDQCDYKNGYKHEVQRHKNIKHLGIVHKCDYCDYTASYKRSLKNHLRTKHNMTP